jgi:mRNA interferase YafQ
LDALLADITDLLAADTPLPPRFRDHPLGGIWDDCRDCHIRPDLVLIYRRPDDDTLQLVRLGSHSELDSDRTRGVDALSWQHGTNRLS